MENHPSDHWLLVAVSRVGCDREKQPVSAPVSTDLCSTVAAASSLLASFRVIAFISTSPEVIIPIKLLQPPLGGDSPLLIALATG